MDEKAQGFNVKVLIHEKEVSVSSHDEGKWSVYLIDFSKRTGIGLFFTPIHGFCGVNEAIEAALDLWESSENEMHQMEG